MRKVTQLLSFTALAGVAAIAACSGGGGTPKMGGGSNPTPTPTATATSTGMAAPAATPLDGRLVLPTGFYGEYVNPAGSIQKPRQLAFLPNGDLIVGTLGTVGSTSSTIYIVPQADAAGPVATPRAFATLSDGQAQGVTYSSTASAIFVGTTNHVWKIPYTSGDQTAHASPISVLHVRPMGANLLSGPPGDTDNHTTTSVLADDVTGLLYVGVGSSCNACVEQDTQRAAVLTIPLSANSEQTPNWAAKHFRNPLALALNTNTNNVWAGGAGQDCLVPSPSPGGATPAPSCVAQNSAYSNGHPYEFMYPVSTKASSSTAAGAADYGWPYCEENQKSYYVPGQNCSGEVQGQSNAPTIIYPAYGTIIGAVFYPYRPGSLSYAFPSGFHGTLFFSGHGSWHENGNGVPIMSPGVRYVPMSQGGDTPQVGANFNSPNGQISTLIQGYQDAQGNRIGQPVGLAVGPQGSLFVADDNANVIYRIRYGTAPAGAIRRAGAAHAALPAVAR